ncbi:MAG: hypothetical protein CMF48_02210 [Legionellales bacterium]|nr:hypothetical protein [Legionellales bacterium]|tara:strand:+ start:666 stop:869 length:204 start_codon:yes stop_codon:yes gene_type:complete
MKERYYQLNSSNQAWEANSDQYPVLVNAILHHLHQPDKTHSENALDDRISEYLHDNAQSPTVSVKKQ